MEKNSFSFSLSYSGYLLFCLGAGTVLGTLFVSLCRDWLWIHFSELPGRLDGPKIAFGNERRYLAYLCLLRLAQLLLPAFLAEGRFKKGIWGCWLFGFAFLMSIWLSLFTLRYRILGALKFGKTMFPQWFFYGLGVYQLTKDGRSGRMRKGKGILFVFAGLFAEILFDFP